MSDDPRREYAVARDFTDPAECAERDTKEASLYKYLYCNSYDCPIDLDMSVRPDDDESLTTLPKYVFYTDGSKRITLDGSKRITPEKDTVLYFTIDDKDLQHVGKRIFQLRTQKDMSNWLGDDVSAKRIVWLDWKPTEYLPDQPNRGSWMPKVSSEAEVGRAEGPRLESLRHSPIYWLRAYRSTKALGATGAATDTGTAGSERGQASVDAEELDTKLASVQLSDEH